MYNPYGNTGFGTNSPYPSSNQYNLSNNYGYGQLPKYEIMKINGKGGVDALQMAPNSELLALDKTSNLVWLIQTDAAGYKTSYPFTITPYEEEKPADVNELSSRITKLEQMLGSIVEGMEELKNDKSNFRNTKQNKQPNGGTNTAAK